MLEDKNVAEKGSLFVVGASAGGVTALEQLISSLPADFPAPIVIAQHLNPDSPSHLKEILGRHAHVEIVLVTERVKLAPRTVYLVPPGQHIEISGGSVEPAATPQKMRPSPSIDLLFQSAARAYGEGVVAVILSGMGNDGAAGASAVKEAGGTVVIQELESAAYSALPASIPKNQIDFVSNLDAMGALFVSLATHDGASFAASESDALLAFLSHMRNRSGIDFTQYKMPTIARRLARLMTATKSDTLAAYMRYLSANPEAYQRLIGTFLIKVTGFFRDPKLFTQLREEILPELIAYARENGNELRVWSAGCATGEEPYSIAMLLAELLGDELKNMHVRIFATDLDSEAIVFARRGIYPESALSSLPLEMRTKYFVKIDDSYQIKKMIRNLTVFGEYDLGQRAPFPRIDVILCCNVLIYFTKQLQQRTLQLFAFSLRVGGYLVLGKAETTNLLPQFFVPVHPMLKIFRRQGERLLAHTPTFSEGTLLSQRASVRSNVRAQQPNPSATAAPRWSLTERLGGFLFDSPIGVIVIDRNYDILTINQAARGFFGIHGQGIGDDLIHLTSGIPASELKNVLDNAFRSEAPIEQEFNVQDVTTGEMRFLHVSCYTEKSESENGRVDGVVILITDATRIATSRRKLEGENVERGTSLDRISRQNEELVQRQRVLIEANNELTASNNNLRSMNEHLQIAAEEAEASAEEVETLNEELQATSEELETLNEELQATIEELHTTNEELRARGLELERALQEQQDKHASPASE